MLPVHLIAEFWDAVRRELRERRGLTEDQAAAAVVGYRAWVDQRQFGDIAYHREPEYTAEVVAGWLIASSTTAAGTPA